MRNQDGGGNSHKESEALRGAEDLESTAKMDGRSNFLKKNRGHCSRTSGESARMYISYITTDNKESRTRIISNIMAN